MEDWEHSKRLEPHPVVSLLIIIGVVFIGFQIIGPMIGFMVAAPFYPKGFMAMVEDIQNPMGHPEIKVPFFIMQGCGSLFGLIIFPMLLLRVWRKSISDFWNASLPVVPVMLTVVIVIAFMGANSLTIEWNASLHLPKSLSGFENWARALEDQLKNVTTFLTQFDTSGQLILGIIVIAVLPGIGEELVFRGLIQNEFYRGTKNIHLSIWVSAILFSAIHMQFFGFVPRLLLGALFGYLYHWSGNLLVPMLAHFVNNGFSVLMMYLYQQGTIEMDLESPEAVPLSMVMSSAVITVALLYYFYKYYHDRNTLTQLDDRHIKIQ